MERLKHSLVSQVVRSPYKVDFICWRVQRANLYNLVLDAALNTRLSLREWDCMVFPA